MPEEADDLRMFLSLSESWSRGSEAKVRCQARWILATRVGRLLEKQLTRKSSQSSRQRIGITAMTLDQGHLTRGRVLNEPPALTGTAYQ
jgi:hypothetical protein